MTNCIVVDDDSYAIEGLSQYLDKMAGFRLVSSFTDPLMALQEITAGAKVDVVFLDVDMPGINGMELSRSIRNKTEKLIFTTSYSHFAYDAFEAEADGFLLKPYSFAKFAGLLNKQFPQVQGVTKNLKKEFFFVKSKEDDLRLVKVRFDEVIAIESIRNYVKIYTFSKSIITYFSLKEIYQLLDPAEFLQIHRAFIVSKKHIASVEGHSIKMAAGLEFTVGDLYKDQFYLFLNQNTFKIGHK